MSLVHSTELDFCGFQKPKEPDLTLVDAIELEPDLSLVDSIQIDFEGFQKPRKPDVSLMDSIELDFGSFLKPRGGEI